jgi:hypothetical protein
MSHAEEYGMVFLIKNTPNAIEIEIYSKGSWISASIILVKKALRGF